MRAGVPVVVSGVEMDRNVIEKDGEGASEKTDPRDGGEEERLAIVTDHHIRTRLNGGEVHTLIPRDKSAVVLIELRDL